jgi:hypothetical protein
LAINLVVPESQDAIAGLAQKLISSRVVTLAPIETVLSTVHLDDELGTSTFEVNDVGRDWRLPAKMVAERPQTA